MLIAFSGPIGAGTSDLSQVVADLLGWPRVKFSDHIRAVAIEQSSDPEDLNVLQAIGQSLVVDHLEEFVTAVLARADWRKDGNLIVDGLRHIEVKTEMLRQIGPVAFHVVHVERARGERAQSRGMNEAELKAYDAELSEAQLERILPQYANCILDGSKDHRELAERVIELFTGRSQSSIAADAGELINLMMPLMIDQGSPRRKRPADLAVELLKRSKDLGARVPKGLAEPLADVVRAMNSYYSNSIEGHVTLPIDIERALNHDYSEEDHDRHNRQVEARAHIEVQRWLDAGNVPLDRVTEQLVLRQIHSQFFSHLPEDFHWVKDGDEEWRVTPGEYRQRYVEVGRHQSVSPGAVPRFMDAFERGYRNLELTDRILASAAAHHRFLWIHPFLDGNGRVARLMSDAMLRSALDASGLWSVTRGLARKQEKYKGLLGQCDLPPRNSLDGRGNLSEEALTDFTIFFLETALDQVDYMEHLVQPDRFEFRLTQLLKEEIAIAKLNPLAENMVLHVSLYGPTAVSRVLDIVGADQPAAEQAINQFVGIGIVARAGEQLKLALPMRLLPRLLPGLFPEDT